jgi:hypothetical protein
MEVSYHIHALAMSSPMPTEQKGGPMHWIKRLLCTCRKSNLGSIVVHPVSQIRKLDDIKENVEINLAKDSHVAGTCERCNELSRSVQAGYSWPVCQLSASQ